MDLIKELVELNTVNRIADLERLESGQTIVGDFDGSVTGKWVRRDDTGAGIVEYNSKQYVTHPIGFTSIPAGAIVEMTFADGTYYSKW